MRLWLNESKSYGEKLNKESLVPQCCGRVWRLAFSSETSRV